MNWNKIYYTHLVVESRLGYVDVKSADSGIYFTFKSAIDPSRKWSSSFRSSSFQCWWRDEFENGRFHSSESWHLHFLLFYYERMVFLLIIFLSPTSEWKTDRLFWGKHWFLCGLGNTAAYIEIEKGRSNWFVENARGNSPTMYPRRAYRLLPSLLWLVVGGKFNRKIAIFVPYKFW